MDKQIIKRQRKDKRLKFTVTLFGGLVLFTLVLLISHLISQALPLAMYPSLSTVTEQTLTPERQEKKMQVLATGDLLEGQPLLASTGQCRIRMMNLDKSAGQLLPFHDYIRPCSHKTAVISEQEQHYIADISDAGQVRIVDVQSIAMTLSPVLASEEPKSLGAGLVSFALPDTIWASHPSWDIFMGERWVVAKLISPAGTRVRWVNRAMPTIMKDFAYPPGARVLPMPGAALTLVYQQGLLSQQSLDGRAKETLVNDEIAWWQSLPKDRTLLTATSDGELTRWVLRNQSGNMAYFPTWRTTLNHSEQPVDASVHATSNALAVLTSKQDLLLMNRVTGEIVSTTTLDKTWTRLAWYGRHLYLTSGTGVSIEKVNWLSGVTTWASLFQPQEYEGYAEADTVWQTTSGSDYQETKYSLVPLLIGSLKASMLALMIAIPVAVGAAIYSAYFSQASMRHWLKPALEMLEAVPSVLIGFVAAIWLAPMAERVLFSFAFFLIVVPVILFVAALFQHRIARRLPPYFRRGTELIVLPLLLLCLGYISMQWAPDWLFSLTGVDSLSALATSSETPIGKTTIVVALALGVAISPTIYSLAEDAISGVPDYLKHASFALGATRLQTLHHVVLQMAMPGILAAIMLGFGRAFGETMIVLMVTGNTPVSDWHLLEGLRALTANLAIELPETDVNSVHYQILFFTACILFGFTFVINTLAELLRQRLRVNARHD